MEIEYDEKGKFFTDVISKEVVRSDIQTMTHHIRGNIHVRKGERLSDEINQPNLFLPVTSAEIYSQDGAMLYTSDFLAVNREHIVWLMPVNDHPSIGELKEADDGNP
jgi:hypothetical protein